jgi:hypothetical protein
MHKDSSERDKCYRDNIDDETVTWLLIWELILNYSRGTTGKVSLLEYNYHSPFTIMHKYKRKKLRT